MKSTDKKSGSPKNILRNPNDSRTISKINAASTRAISGTRVIPIIRTVEIPSPQFFQTDPVNFSDLVQKLTGKEPRPKNLSGLKKTKSRVRSQSGGNNQQFLAAGGDHSFAKHVSEEEIKKNLMEESGVQVCDVSSKLFVGFEEQDFSGISGESTSTLSEFAVIYHPIWDQIDHQSSVSQTVKWGEFNFE